MSGYAFQGVCLQSQTEAINAFLAGFPRLDSGAVWYITNNSPNGTDGVNFTMQNQATVFPQTVSGVVRFDTCDFDTSGFSAMPSQSLLFVAALFFAACFGFYSGFRP